MTLLPVLRFPAGFTVRTGALQLHYTLLLCVRRCPCDNDVSCLHMLRFTLGRLMCTSEVGHQNHPSGPPLSPHALI